MSIEDELQEAAAGDELVIGTEESLKKMAALDTVVMASNVPDDIAAEIEEEADDEDVEVHRVDVDNRQLGALCMEPFSASVVGIQ